jgi:hypothetical protein
MRHYKFETISKRSFSVIGLPIKHLSNAMFYLWGEEKSGRTGNVQEEADFFAVVLFMSSPQLSRQLRQRQWLPPSLSPRLSILCVSGSVHVAYIR